MKYCKHCGKELDQEANFCPYCMTRQENPSPAPQLKVKKRTPKIAIFSVLGILLAGGVIALLLLFPSEKAVPQPEKEPQTNQTKEPPSTLETNSSAYDLHQEFDSLLGADFEEVKSFFGSEMAPFTVDPFTEAEIHYFSGIEIAVLPAGGKILSYTVDYQQSDPPHRYNYRGIDHSTTYKEIQSLLGLPYDDSNYPFEVTYAMEQGFMKFSFDDQLHVTKIYAFYPYE